MESCRGRKELFYEFDYFYDFDGNPTLVTDVCSYSISNSKFSYYGCHILKIFHLLSMINIVDIFIIFRIAISVKSQTLSITSLLTSKALKERKRYVPCFKKILLFWHDAEKFELNILLLTHTYIVLYRNDGIIISISVWQVIVEAIFNITYLTLSYFLSRTTRTRNLGISKVSMTLFHLFFSYIILPSFYFLADQKFRSTFKESGIMKAIWCALKQKYD